MYGDDSGEPIEGASVLDVLSGVSSLTSSTGTVSLGYLRDGRNIIRIQKVGYQPVTMPVVIGPSDTLPITVTLTRVTQLPTVISKSASSKYKSPALQGYEERRIEGHGYFITDSTLRANEHSTLASVIGRIPSISVASYGRVRQALSTRAMSNGKMCAIDIYLDGVLVYSSANPSETPATAMNDPVVKAAMKANSQPSAQGGANAANLTAADLGQFSISDLAGVEFHNVADMPIEFAHTNGGCGALFLWTREK